MVRDTLEGMCVGCYLFGSYAKGCADEKSDVDLLVVLAEDQNDFRTRRTLTERLREAFDAVGVWCNPLYSTFSSLLTDSGILYRQYVKHGICIAGNDISGSMPNETDEELK